MIEAVDSTSRRGFLAGAPKAMIAAAAALHLAERPAAAQATPQAARMRKPTAGSPSPAYSRAMSFDGLVFVAGCVGVDAKGNLAKDFETQAMQTLLNLKESIERSGSKLDRVLKCTCFLKEFQHFAEFNKVYMKVFPEPRPARSTVVVKDFVVPGALLEVDCVCHL